METTLTATSGDIKDLTRYVRPKDVIRTTGLSKSAVMAALRSGELRGRRYRRAWLIPVEAVDEWLQRHTDVA